MSESFGALRNKIPELVRENENLRGMLQKREAQKETIEKVLSDEQ